MIRIENVEVCGWKSAIRGMRNPMNSWDKSDSFVCKDDLGELTSEEIETICGNCTKGIDKCDIYDKYPHFIVGNNDLTLMKKLAKAGTDHRKFMRMIVVYADVTAPLYWWKEADTYKVGTVRNSCSTMHKITEKEFTLDDFSHEHLLSRIANDDDKCRVYISPISALENQIKLLNAWRKEYLRSKNKDDWWQIIQLLPSSYNQRATLMLNYEVLANMYHTRKAHKLDEWVDFCKWIESLPYAELITGVNNKDLKVSVGANNG